MAQFNLGSLYLKSVIKMLYFTCVSGKNVFKKGIIANGKEMAFSGYMTEGKGI